MRANYPNFHNQIGKTMANRLTIIFFLILFIEIVLFFFISDKIGWGTSIWWVLISGFLGVMMTKNQSVSMLQQLIIQVNLGKPPKQKITEGVILLCGGLMLIAPGFFTDTLGLILLVPPLRRIITPLIHNKIAVKINPAYQPPKTEHQEKTEKQIEPTIEPQKNTDTVFDNNGWWIIDSRY